MASGSSGGLSISSDDELAINKLEYLKELRDVTIELNGLKSKLRQEIDSMENEKKCLATYRKEKEFLEHEKMAHVEELRLIHSDLHQMENVIKESEVEHNHHLRTAKSLLQELQQLQNHANKIRTGLGLTHLAELPEEEEKIKHELFRGQRINDHTNPGRETIEDNLMLNKPLLSSNIPQSYLVPPLSSMSQRTFKPNLPPPGINLMAASHQLGVTGSGTITERQPSAAFRQQPPPMKSCLSCHQQIHRNAPICPLCKAKSRSRNPKKPKRKTED